MIGSVLHTDKTWRGLPAMTDSAAPSRAADSAASPAAHGGGVFPDVPSPLFDDGLELPKFLRRTRA